MGGRATAERYLDGVARPAGDQQPQHVLLEEIAIHAEPQPEGAAQGVGDLGVSTAWIRCVYFRSTNAQRPSTVTVTIVGPGVIDGGKETLAEDIMARAS